MNVAFKPRHSLLIILVLVALGLACLVGKGYHAPPATPDAGPEKGADVTLDNIDYTETRDGRPYWRLQAARGSHDLSTGTTRLEQVQVVFFGTDPERDLKLKADTGVWNRQTGELEATGHVEARDERGYTVRSDRMYYDRQKRLVWTDGPVHLTGTGVEVKGRGLRLDIDARRLTLLADVWSRWQLDLVREGRG